MASAIKVTVDLSGMGELSARVHSQCKLIVAKTAFDLQAEAAGSMSGPRSGRIYRKSKGVVHQASAPGEVPAVDTGNLKNSIQAHSLLDGLTAEVTVGAEYAEVLEFGGAHLAPRPFLGPAAERVRPGFEKAVASAVKQAARE